MKWCSSSRSRNISVVVFPHVETQCPGYNWATLFLGDINTGTWAPYRMNNKVIVKRKEKIKSEHGPQREARYQDELACV
jgi:hypothetical protein